MTYSVNVFLLLLSSLFCHDIFSMNRKREYKNKNLIDGEKPILDRYVSLHGESRIFFYYYRMIFM